MTQHTSAHISRRGRNHRTRAARAFTAPSNTSLASASQSRAMANGLTQLCPAGERCPRAQRSAERTARSPRTRPGISTSAHRATPAFSSTAPKDSRSGRSRRLTRKSTPSCSPTEGAEEYLYVTVQKGTPQENWLFLKMKTDGSVVLKITAPPEAGFKSPNEWRITAALPTPDGSIFIANGYGDSRIFRFDKSGNYKASYSGKGSADGQLDCSHGLALDTRYDQPLLLVCDRENRRLCHFDLDGNYVRTITSASPAALPGKLPRRLCGGFRTGRARHDS